MPGILKNLLDRMTSLEQERKALKGKGCGIVVSYQEEGAIQVVKDLMIVLNEMGFWFPPFSFLYAREEELYGEDIRAGAYQLGRNLLLFYRALKEVPAQEWWEREAVD
jgi:NAD(P)H-dependent FMN reductase